VAPRIFLERGPLTPADCPLFLTEIHHSGSLKVDPVGSGMMVRAIAKGDTMLAFTLNHSFQGKTDKFALKTGIKVVAPFSVSMDRYYETTDYYLLDYILPIQREVRPTLPPNSVLSAQCLLSSSVFYSE
jgi:hypothetical protein